MYKYRTLEAWKRAHESVIATLTATDGPTHPRARDLFSQLRRAAVSIEANVVEGYALASRGYYRRHLRIALGSAAEAECLVRVAQELAYLSTEDATRLEDLLGATMKTICGILKRGGAPISQ